MKLLSHFKGEFSGWDEGRRRALLGELLTVMNREVTEYIGQALVLPYAWRNTSEARRTRLRDPYYGCLAFCLKSVTSYAAEVSRTATVNVMMAQHPEFSGFASHIFDAYKEKEENGERLGVLRLGTPAQTPALQVSDIVSYEIARYILEREVRGRDVIRWPLQQIRKKSHHYLRLLHAPLS